MDIECKTVGEVKAALAGLPDHLPVCGTAHDCGGYDAILSHVVVVQRNGDDNVFIAGKDEERGEY